MSARKLWPAEQTIAAMAALTPAQAREHLSNIGRAASLRLVRHLSIVRPGSFRGDEWFEAWRDVDLEKKAAEILFSA